jgi:hypothetical protein
MVWDAERGFERALPGKVNAMSGSEFPENRPKDMNGVPIPSQVEIESARILKARIARDKAVYEAGFAAGGHGKAQDDSEHEQ